MKRMLAEFEKIQAILMAFPHEFSDWAYCIKEARESFLHIIQTIAKHAKVLVCVHTSDTIGYEMLKNLPGVEIARIDTNDTWARDFGAISIENQGVLECLDFGFNGWGLKYPSNLDNQVNFKLKSLGFLKHPLKTMPYILEGGSIESDGAGSVLTNTQCLLEKNRNPHLNQNGIENMLKKELGAKQVLWYSYGYLKGDDTNSHTDTLARFLDKDTIVYSACEDKNDEHYTALKKMQEELKTFKKLDGTPYKLIPLEIPKAIYDENQQRLPATYVNFLLCNNALIVPTYNDPKDALILETLKQHTPLEVIGVDCNTLIKQHGSLHCVTMQLY
ncbi:agmatine deiminase family protein [Helicobacter pylori]|uniref:agmatine deiminase family protein n=1 Tax=Helicobacter pylori TaxID=210 RepID=UPI0034665722